MTGKLRLGPLPRTEVVRLTIVLPATIKADLDRYAKLYGAAYGAEVDAATLVPHMLAAFMGRDRAFQRTRQSEGSSTSDSPTSINEATASANATASHDASASR